MPQANSKSTRVVSSRRQFLGAVAVTIAASPAVALALATDDDAEIIQLAKQLEQLQAHFSAACRSASECSNRFEEITPERPSALFVRFSDDLDTPTVRSRDKNGAERLMYSLPHIDTELRGQATFHRWGFNGTQEQLDELGIKNWQDNRILPDVGEDHLHLFFSIGDEHRKQRAGEIISAYDEYSKDLEQAKLRSGVDEAEAAVDDINEQMHAIVVRMLELEPKTVAGLKALATAVRLHCWAGFIDESDALDERLINLMIRSLTEGELHA